METPCAGSPGKLRQTPQLNCYNALFTQSSISRHQHACKNADIIQRKALLSLQTPPICCQTAVCQEHLTPAASCPAVTAHNCCSDTSMSCGKEHAENSTVLQPPTTLSCKKTDLRNVTDKLQEGMLMDIATAVKALKELKCFL